MKIAQRICAKGIIRAIHENGVFRPLTPVDLPDGCRVAFEPHVVSGEDAQNLDAIYEILDERYASGHTDTAERHNEHHP